MEGLTTGLPEVDVEHHLQLQLVQEIRDAVLARRERAVVSALLLQLEDVSATHFASEELLMRMHAWHRTQPHVEEHRRLVEELRVLRADLEAGTSAELVVALDQLASWLANHIRGMDRAFAQAVAAARATPSP